MKIDYSLFFEDKSRWVLWWPVGLGIGISTYFCLPFEPSLTQTSIVLLLSLVGTFVALRQRNDHLFIFLISIASLSMILGFSAAKVRSDWLATPFLSQKIERIRISGRLIDIEEQHNRRRLTLDQLTFEDDTSRLNKIRLTHTLSKPLMATLGDRISLETSLLPVSDPVSINGYNFRRQAYFLGMGATGHIKSPIQILKKQDKRLWLEATRYRLTKSIRQQLPGQIGEIAVALITGDRSGIHPHIRQAFTDAGLAHILAISGLHLTLVAGLIFLFFRRGLALIPYLAENYPIKKWAAILVAFATFAYLAISGFGIPGQRAFVMISIVMLGILLDRNPLSMRLVAVAATLILLLRPESLLSASFQLSFAAVIALIAAYEGGWSPLRQWSLEGRYSRKIIAYGAGLIATTLIATLATTPFTLALFNRITLQTIVGNFLAIPLTSILIMPAATFSVFSLLFGGIEFAFQMLSFGIKQLIRIAEMVSSWPGAAILVPTPPPSFLGLITLGALWICIWKSYWRWLGIIPCGTACIILFFQNSPTIYASGDGSVIAYSLRDVLYISNLKKGSFYANHWMKELGLTQKKEWTQDQVHLGNCLMIRSSDYNLPISKEMCQHPCLITTGYAWRECREWGHLPKILIDRYTLKKEGIAQIWTNTNFIKVKFVKRELGIRPWS
ncbi:MAG: ComEC/Rec2 family competence protein [Alphaproteobacteria bacterium]|nr:ComEC/Rec2 family competence protein [Alphaproteobacteria bacterium]